MTEILKIGVPTLVFQLLTSLSIALINRASSNYGDSVIAGMGAVTRITSMGTLVVFGLKVDELASNMTYMELSTNPRYMDEFVAACFLPHTSRELFPSSIQE